jgi:hypothetical protein
MASWSGQFSSVFEEANIRREHLELPKWISQGKIGQRTISQHNTHRLTVAFPLASTETRSGFNLHCFQEMSHIKMIMTKQIRFPGYRPLIFRLKIKRH